MDASHWWLLSKWAVLIHSTHHVEHFDEKDCSTTKLSSGAQAKCVQGEQCARWQWSNCHVSTPCIMNRRIRRYVSTAKIKQNRKNAFLFIKTSIHELIRAIFIYFLLISRTMFERIMAIQLESEKRTQ